jgi:hypothetical protein
MYSYISYSPPLTRVLEIHTGFSLGEQDRPSGDTRLDTFTYKVSVFHLINEYSKVPLPLPDGSLLAQLFSFLSFCLGSADSSLWQ